MRHAAEVSEEELAAAVTAAGFPPDPQLDRRATARPATLRVRTQVVAGQLYLLDRGHTVASVLPLPNDAASAGIVDVVPGGAVLWTPHRSGPLDLTVVLAPYGPEPVLDDHDDIVEISYRSPTGQLSITELDGTRHDLPSLPGHGDYRLRYHVRADGPAHLLQIWRDARRRPTLLKVTSPWAVPRTGT
ncbi:hypothetical protein [Actinomadura sp. 9N407]|uniref:hypothetical protein n=1 Tax=Actinomadura sp. 9N407 TaxID=3375154 RepID=UPI0037BB19DF